MERKIKERLIQWKNSKNRNPLIIDGARQVGKTYIALTLGKEFYKNKTVYISILKIQKSYKKYLIEIWILTE